MKSQFLDPAGGVAPTLLQVWNTLKLQRRPEDASAEYFRVEEGGQVRVDEDRLRASSSVSQAFVAPQ